MLALRAACREAWHKTRAGFTSLSGSPRDLWVIYTLKALESYNYFSLSRSLTLYLTEEFGISDLRAGYLYGVWGTLLTAYGFLLGGAIDFMGVRLSLALSFSLNCASRLVMAATSSSTLLLAMLLVLNAGASALGIPVLTIAVKRYTHVGNRGFAFALFYSLMNVAALSQGVLMDFFRIALKHGFGIASLPERSLLNSGSRLFLASGCVTSCAGIFLALKLREGAPAAKRTASEALPEGSVHSHATASSVEVELPTSPEVPLLGSAADRGGSASGSSDAKQGGPATAPTPRHRAHGKAEGTGPAGAAQEQEWAPDSASGGSLAAGGGGAGLGASMLEGMREIMTSRGFYKFLCMCLFTVNLKSVFRHLDATLPKYQLRAFGCDTKIGLIYAINPAMIVLLVPVVGALTTEFEHFDVIHYGSYLSALSPFFIVAFDTLWSTAAFVALLSLGEAVWSPRWYDYSMGVAPQGREGMFTAMASAPLFLATAPTGMLSGALLARFCPDRGQCADDGPGGSPSRRLLGMLGGGRWLRGLAVAAGDPGLAECNGRVLWAVVGGITCTSPLLVLLTQRWIRPDAGDYARGADAAHRARSPAVGGAEGEWFDVNAADPSEIVENVFEAGLLRDAERGGLRPGSAAGRPGSRGTG